jgi:hypothetical protein
MALKFDLTAEGMDGNSERDEKLGWLCGSRSSLNSGTCDECEILRVE